MQIRTMLLLVVVLAIVATACGDGGGGAATTTSSVAPTTAPVTDTTLAPETTTSTPPPPTTRGPRPDPGPVADGPTLEGQYTAIAPGTYRTERLGWPLSFSITGEWWVQPNEPGRVVITHPDSIGPGDRDIVFFRPTFLADPHNPMAALDTQDGWELTDIEGWLDGLAPSISIRNRSTSTIGSYDATVFDVTLPDNFPCGPEACVFFAHNARIAFIDFFPGNDFRVYWIDGGEREPLAIWIGSGAVADWFATAETVLDTVALGDPGPHPLDPDAPWEGGVPADVPAGYARFPAGDGIGFTLDQERFVFQNNGLVAVTLAVSGVVTFFFPISDGSGDPVATVDEVEEAIRTSSAEVAVGEPEPDLPFDARVLDYRAPGFEGELLLKWDDTPDRGAAMDRLARIWILDTPRGPLVVTAQTEGDEAEFEVVVALARQLLPTLELVDLP
ncbi:MAG: hypothetical protein QNJ88_01415 [Acidimicrobiia bacterium]|nr:hypothetical protein [Acidimicrobiia bacterium]